MEKIKQERSNGTGFKSKMQGEEMTELYRQVLGVMHSTPINLRVIAADGLMRLEFNDKLLLTLSQDEFLSLTPHEILKKAGCEIKENRG